MDLQEIIKPKNFVAAYAPRSILGFYMDHFFLGVHLAEKWLAKQAIFAMLILIDG
jgi:hypothetical protein